MRQALEPRAPSRSLGHCSRPRLEPLAAPQQVRDTLLELTLGYPQPPARGQELGDVGAFLGDPHRFAGSCQIGRGIQRSALDVHGHRHRDEQLRDEMRVLHQQQPGLCLDLRIVQRTLRECARGVHRVEDALPGRVALMAGTLQRGVQQPGSQLIPLADDQRQQRREPGGRLRAGRQAGRECRLDFIRRRPRLALHAKAAPGR